MSASVEDDGSLFSCRVKSRFDYVERRNDTGL